MASGPARQVRSSHSASTSPVPDMVPSISAATTVNQAVRGNRNRRGPAGRLALSLTTCSTAADHRRLPVV